MTYWYINHVKEGPIHWTSGGGYWSSREISPWDAKRVWVETHFTNIKDARYARLQICLGMTMKAFKQFKIIKVTRKEKG